MSVIWNKIKELAKTMYKKICDLAEIVRLSYKKHVIAGQITGEYTKLGEASYKAFKTDTVDDSINIVCGEIKMLEEKSDTISESIRILRNEKRCPDCGAVLKRDMKFCPYCGEKQPELSTENVVFVVNGREACPVCGEDRNNGAQFCSRCGFRFESEEAK